MMISLDPLRFGERREAQLPHQVAFQRGTGSEARFQRGHFLGCFVFAGLNETGVLANSPR